MHAETTSDRIFRRMAAESPAIRELLADLARHQHEYAVTRAKADPAKHKLTRNYDADARMTWRYYDAGNDGRGRKVWFCWATTRNAAGYFLGWRQVMGKESGKRDQWLARKQRQAVKAIALKRRDAFRAKGKPAE